MKNIGPINATDKQKSGKEFLNDLFKSSGRGKSNGGGGQGQGGEDGEACEYDDEEEGEEEDYEEEDDYEEEAEPSTLSYEDRRHNTSAGSFKKTKSKDTLKFIQDSRAVLLNLSKSTLRHIILLICDEAVRNWISFA